MKDLMRNFKCRKIVLAVADVFIICVAALIANFILSQALALLQQQGLSYVCLWFCRRNSRVGGDSVYDRRLFLFDLFIITSCTDHNWRMPFQISIQKHIYHSYKAKGFQRKTYYGYWRRTSLQDNPQRDT